MKPTPHLDELLKSYIDGVTFLESVELLPSKAVLSFLKSIDKEIINLRFHSSLIENEIYGDLSVCDMPLFIKSIKNKILNQGITLINTKRYAYISQKITPSTPLSTKEKFTIEKYAIELRRAIDDITDILNIYSDKNDLLIIPFVDYCKSSDGVHSNKIEEYPNLQNIIAEENKQEENLAKLPDKFNIPEIIEVFNKLCEVQVRGKPICKNTGDVYHWEGSQALLGYFVHKFSEKFQLLKNKRVNWKLFQTALSFDDKIKKGAIKDYSESSSDGGCLHPGYKEINKILK